MDRSTTVSRSATFTFELQGVSKSFDGTTALHPTNLQIGSGKTTVLLGPSGCGKSTLIRLINGLIVPDQGTVIFQGEPLTRDRERSSRHRMGYVVQDGGLFPHLTARENVGLLARTLGWSQNRIEERADELAQLAQLPEGALDRYPAQMSGGQRQRVSLIRALMLDPPVVLLDEPLGALDPVVRSELQADLRTIFRELNKTVVLVTHDLGEAGYLGDELVVLQTGRILQQGTLSQLVNQPADPFVTKFINAQRSPLEALDGGRP